MKNYKVLILAMLMSAISIASTCKKKDSECLSGSHDWFTLTNNSASRINFEIYWNYPDTLIGEYNPTGFGVILTGASRTKGAGRYTCWESVLKDGKKEYLYIFNEDSLQTTPWNIIQATNRGLLERREISLNYLQRNNFQITYP